MQNINAKANRENWLKRKRIGQGGGHEYHINSFPIETQQFLAKQTAEFLANELNNESACFLAGKTVAKNIQQKEKLNNTDKKRIMENGAAQLMQLQGKQRLKTQIKLTIIAAYKTG